MRVILLQDVDKLGKKYDVKEVTDGYARNFLFPKNLARPVTRETLEWLEIQKENEAKRAEEELARVQGWASKLDGMELIVTVKTGQDSQLFESVNAQKIVEKLREAGFEIKKTQIDLAQAIKELGEFPVKIKFEHNLEAEIKVIIVEEK